MLRRWKHLPPGLLAWDMRILRKRGAKASRLRARVGLQKRSCSFPAQRVPRLQQADRTGHQTGPKPREVRNPSIADLLGSMRKHDISGRIANGFADSLHHNEQASDPPIRSQ